MIERTSAMLDNQKLHKVEEGEQRKRGKTLSKVKPVENISKAAVN